MQLSVDEPTRPNQHNTERFTLFVGIYMLTCMARRYSKLSDLAVDDPTLDIGQQ